MDLGENYFGVIDYILLTVTLLVSLLIGLYYGYTGKQTNEQLLMGGRNMSILPVAASVFITYVSAITILGFPSEIYAHGAQIFILHLVSAVGIPISAFLLLPFFYGMKLTSINEYIENRFESIWIRWLSSALFILQQVMVAGVILYAPSLALEKFVGFPMWMSVLGIGVCATVYTNVGGLKAVVWTDAFQFVMMVGGMIVIVWKGFIASGGMSRSMELVKEGGRHQLFDFTFDPFTRHNFWNFLIGTGFYSIMQPGIHQLQVQRYCGMPTCSKAKQAIIGSVPLNLIFMSLCLLTGFAIYAFYANCDPLTKGDITKIDQIVPYFVVHELRDIPGMMGIFTSCLICGVLSSLSSSLNSLAAVSWEDFLSRIKFFNSMSPSSQTNITRLVGVFFGFVCMGLAFSAQNFGSVYSAAYAVTGATYGALFGLFIMAMFLPFVNTIGAIAGALSGLIAVGIVSIMAIVFKNTNSLTSLPVSIEHCPAVNITSSNFPSTMLRESATSSISLDEWPWRVFSLSYLLYPNVASIISIIVGTIVSLLVCIWNPSYRNRHPRVAYVHPLARRIFRRFVDSSESRKYNSNGSNGHFNGKANGTNGTPMKPIVNETTAASA